jgi:cytoskeletal protein CcmA (bactofilin family)
VPAPLGRSSAPGPLTRDAASAAAAAAPVLPPSPAPAVPGPAADGARPAPATGETLLTSIGPDTPGSRLCVGPKIKLKGVEISDCDVLVVEGEVEATVNSKAMQIAKPGTLKGHVAIDVAEIFGDFSGELTARAKLIVHGTGRVSGKIRYGKLIVAEGGELSGDVQRLDANAQAAPARSIKNEAFALASPEATS